MSIFKKDHIIEALKKELLEAEVEASRYETGRVVEVGDSIIRIAGLPNAKSLEMLEVHTVQGRKVSAVTLNLESHEIGAMVLGETRLIHEGDEVVGTGKVLEVAVGEKV